MIEVKRKGPKKISVLFPLPETTQNKEIKKRAAAYCRVSTGSDEQLSSFIAQIEYYKNYINVKSEYTLAGIYADEGISGTDIRNRDEFKRMLYDCQHGLIDIIITKSVSRFGRNTVDCLNSIRELKALGIDVYFEKENIHTMRSEGELLLTLISATAQSESMNLSENVKWGIHRKYEQGEIKSIPSGKFLGYDKDDDGNLVVNEEQAEIVIRIYREFLDGYGCMQIADRLTKKNVPMVYGGVGWCPSHIKNVLTNEKYKGDTLFQKTYNTDYLTKKRAKNNGDLPQYYYEDTHTAIIDKNTWECVQFEFERHKQYCEEHYISKYHNSNEHFPFSGRVICDTCGHTYVLLGSKRLDEIGKKYWRCSSYHGNNGTVIEGKTFTPPPQHTKLDDGSPEARARAIRRKPPEERQMFCTDIQIIADEPEKAFISAWNQLVERYESHVTVWEDIVQNATDPLLRYRTSDMLELIKDWGRIDRGDYRLVFRVLDHIEVGVDGSLEVVFLSGARF